MAKIAIITDIHANLQALKAVLRDVSSEGLESLVCLGDVVGYGANPAECVDLLRAIRCVGVMGNHDFYTCTDSMGIQAALDDPGSLGNPVWEGIRHAREQLDDTQMEWLRGLLQIHHQEGAVMAHAALHDFAEWPYLLTAEEAEATLDLLDGRIGFFGHTHREAVFAADDGSQPELVGDGKLLLPEGCSVAITVGSVGQPRGGDLRAHWLSWDSSERVIEFRRTPYDSVAAAAAIVSAGLPEESASRIVAD